MKDTTINHGRLKEFCDTIIMQAREVLYEREEDILKAWHENIEEAQCAGKDFPPLKLGIGATVDLENNTIETTLRFTAVYQSKLSTEIPDPNQPELPGVTRGEVLKTAVKEAAMGGKFAKAFKGTLAKHGGSVSVAVDGETVYDSAADDEHDGPRIVDADERKTIKAKRGKKHQPEGEADDY